MASLFYVIPQIMERQGKKKKKEEKSEIHARNTRKWNMMDLSAIIIRTIIP